MGNLIACGGVLIRVLLRNFNVISWNNGNGVLSTLTSTSGITKALVTLSGWGVNFGGAVQITGTCVKSCTQLAPAGNGATGVWLLELDGSVDTISLNGYWFTNVAAHDPHLIDIC